MLFNSLEYLIFLPVVFSGYWLIPPRYRWIFLLAASCFFYMAFIPYYILILALTITVDYFAVILIDRSEGKRLKVFYLTISIISTCLILFFFKYFNFFDKTIDDISRAFHLSYNRSLLNIVLPIGLSFHTFQSLSYVIEVYRGKQKPERHFGIYSLYVMFFPQLVAGPIERPQNLLVQLRDYKSFDLAMAKDGMRQILWGLFKKVVIADTAAAYVNKIFGAYDTLSGPTLILGVIYFAFQIYCDFSGYSDIAIGTARLFGISLMRNFAYPYFSRDIAEFWRRWHISLSTWFRDYIYIPLGGSRVSTPVIIRNNLIVFTISGLWHGANWTYIVWGFINGIYLIPLILFKSNRRHLEIIAPNSTFPSIKESIQILFTFSLTLIAWVFFRAENVNQAFLYLQRMATNFEPVSIKYSGVIDVFKFILILIIVEWVQRRKQHGLEISDIKHRAIRWGIYYSLFLCILFYGVFENVQFIYFQF